ncbi:MAG: hypothetical protein EOP34_05035 [Rickettsiales bacterium]|nr:MAG: hypothetical protein EOP34_05035 [Rickettsiales bacterium]
MLQFLFYLKKQFYKTRIFKDKKIENTTAVALVNTPVIDLTNETVTVKTEELTDCDYSNQSNFKESTNNHLNCNNYDTEPETVDSNLTIEQEKQPNDIVKECFKIINEFPDFYVSNLGSVYCVSNGKKIKPDSSTTGLIVCLELVKSGITYKASINLHDLVCAYFGNKEIESFNSVRHIDGNVENNHFHNLEWVNGINKSKIASQILAPSYNPKKRKII